jgi:uroporphyrinogen-III synthase
MSLAGLRVVAFESRRAAEIAELIRRHGGEPMVAPTMREVPLSDDTGVREYVRALDAGEIDVVVLLTGVGLRALMNMVANEWPAPRFTQALRRAKLVARGPKPMAVLREIGLTPDVTVPEPNTWRELLAALDAELPVAGLRVAVQEYGIANQELLAGLAARGANVRRVAIYSWELPDDLEPLRRALRAVCDATVDAALFTSANQVFSLFQVAAGDAEQLRRGFERVVIASIGPMCSQALREHGLSPDLEPEHPKMGHLVSALARSGRDLVLRKRGSGHLPVA